MSLKEKERAKEQQEKFQAILSALLKDEDNKYCVDCDAKGPRWASWNLGIFLCIRCAGIHRNLGVHISKVKSVNLDTWTPEQVAMMQEIGNSRGRAVYEANIPDGFRRPQGDSALEAFVRSKYEQKKYIAREWIPPTPKIPKEWFEDSRAEKRRAKQNKQSGQVQLPSIPKAVEKPSQSRVDAPKQNAPVKTEVKVPTQTVPKQPSASNDLLGLDLGVSRQTNTQQPMGDFQAAAPSSGGNELLDLFGGPQNREQVNNPPGQAPAGADLMNGGTSEANLFGSDSQSIGNTEEKKSAKDSIMALFGGGGGGGGAPQPQMYGVPASQMTGPPVSVSTQVVVGSDDLIKMKDTAVGNVVPAHGVAVSSYAQMNSLNQNQQMALLSAMRGLPVSMGMPTQAVNTQQQMAQQPTMSTQQQPIMCTQQLPTILSQQLQSAPHSIAKPYSVGYKFPGQQEPIQWSGMPQHSQPEKSLPTQLNTSTGGAVTWNAYNQMQPGFYGTQGGVYMPQGQMYQQNMMGPQPGMMAAPQATMMTQQQGIIAQQQSAMMAQQSPLQQGMMGTPQGMMRPQQGMMGQPMMNGSQPNLFNGHQPMMGPNPAMYNPQQMQQLQFQQMQQQMTSMKINGTQTHIGAVPQQAMPGATASWGAPSSGHTLSNNLWQ